MNPTEAPIAIIGAGCRFPGGASSLDKLWELLSEGRNGWTEIPKDRWHADEWFDAYPEAKQSMVTKHGYFLQEDISRFDAKFFGISSQEARSMDPQQRLFLMTTYEALEDAAIPIETLRGSNTGVFASIFERSYDRMGHKDLSTISRTHMNGTGESILSNRISYCFDLKGPCMTIDTGCSGSLVALHQACHSLRLGESDLALVGGSQLVIHPDVLTIMSGMGMLNPDGKSYAFDSRGAGYGRGEGVATVVLKRLDRALDDGDQIHAIIANSGLNQDGRTSGLNTPSGDAQASLALRVYREAGLNPIDTSFVEAHGTGTQVGDREEIASISSVFCEDSARTNDLYVGSIKTNIGHLEAASGIAGLLKSILVLKHGHIPPNLEFIKPKPSLKLYERKIKIPTELTKLPTPGNGGSARVSLNSFGYGGTNCHVILQAADSGRRLNGINGVTSNGTKAYQKDRFNNESLKTAHSKGSLSYITKSHSPNLIVLSAATEKALLLLSQNLSQWAKTHQMEPQTLRSLSYTLGVHRSVLPYRRAFVASTAEELLAELDLPGYQRRIAPLVPVTFVFSGQGAQWHAMGQELISSSDCFRHSMSAMDSALRRQGCQWSLVKELSRSPEDSRVNEAEIAQPATTAIQIALVDLFESLSIRPSTVIGHSSGEIAAAYAAGALSRNSAILVAYHRGLSSSKAKKLADVSGSMMAVSLGETEAMQYVKKLTSGTAVVACVNSPLSTTLSGDETAIDEIKAALDADGVFARKLRVDTAYHSHHMQRVAKDYKEAISSIESFGVRNDVTFYSSVTGAIKSNGFGADYWTSNLVSQVMFSQALTMLRDDQIKHEANMDVSIFVEIGPHSALAGPSRQTLKQGVAEKFKFEYISALLRNTDAEQTTLALVGRMFELGVDVDITAVLTRNDETKPEIIRDLKSYPWDLVPFWHESRLSKANRFRQFPYHDLLGLLDPVSTINEPRWRYFLNLDALPWLRDHVVEGFTLYPGAGFLTMAIEAMKQLVQMRHSQTSIAKFILRDVVISKSIVLNESDDSSSSEVEVQLSMSTGHQYEGSRWESFRIWSYNADGSWSEHCSGEITVEYETDEIDEVEGTREADLREEEAMRFLDTARRSCDTDMTKTEFYQFARLTGNDWKDAFNPIVSVKHGNKRGLLEICNPDISSLMPYRFFRPHVVHPITLDAVYQLSGMLFKKSISNAACVPTKIPLLEISANISTTAGDTLTGATRIEADGPKASKGESWVFQKGADGQLNPVIRLSMNLRAIGEAREDENRLFVQDKVNRLNWNPDVAFTTDTSFLDEISSTLGLDDNTTYSYEGIKVSVQEAQNDFLAADQAAFIWMRNAVRYVKANNVDIKTPQLVQYSDWMKKWLGSEYCRQITSGLDLDEENRILHRVESSVNAAELQSLARIGKALPDILSGARDTLTVLLEGNLLARLYEGGTFTGDYEAAVEYLKMLTFKNPRLRLLEIGAGTGGCTKKLFRGISSQNASGLPIERYTYTDVSSGFFEEARETFAEWEDLIDFRTLDVEMDPLEQGFESGSYDVVIASNVLHATKQMDVTMGHVRSLLRPGGSLILVEIAPRGAVAGLISGGFAGWWAHEDEYRVDTPLMHREQWAEILSKNGFGGIHVAWGNMMASKAVSSLSNGTLASNSVVLLRNGVDGRVDKIVTEIASHNIDTRECSWEELNIEKNTAYLVIDRAEKPLLLDPQPQLFKTINALLNAKSNVLWVVLQDTADLASTAYKGLVTSFVRVLRRESGNTGLVNLDIRHRAPHPGDIARVVADVTRQCFWPATHDQRSLEPELAYENGRILIPRVMPDADFLKWARSRGVEAAAEMEAVPYQGDRVLKAIVATPGLLNSLHFVDNDVSPSIEPEQIEVKADAHGVNYRDVCVALGQMGPGVSMAGEFAGVVTAVGEDMRHVYQIGDRVMGFGAPPFSNLPRVHGYQAHKIPSWMSVIAAASIPHAYVTAYHCIMEIARLKRGQSVFIPAASGGVGQAAIQLAQHVGATIFCTVSTAAKRQLITDNYGIPPSHVFSSQTRSLTEGIMRLTNGEGVDVVLSSSGGEALRDSLDCVKTLGTIIALGKSEMQRGSQLSMTAFDRSITFTAFDVAALREPKHVHRLLREIVELIESKILRPVHPISTYHVDQIEDAFRFLDSRKHIGKVVLSVEPTSMVKCLPAKPLPLRLRKDGAYIVAGGLGDLPSRICVFLASRGAGHVVSLSRRTIDDATKQKHMAAVEAYGGQLHILQCDITIDDNMRHAVAYCSALPPVRGVVQGTLALSDRTFSQMTVEEWKLPLQPKVFGTINLNKFFASSELAFFVTLSSIVGVIGKSGQSNYAAGNGFQDAFASAHASHPHTQYASINVGAVSLDSHQVSQGETSISSIRTSIRQNSVMNISFDEFFANLEYVITGLAQDNGVYQSIQAVTRQSILDANDEHLLENPVFSQLTRVHEKKAADAGGAEKVDFGKTLSSVKTMAEAEQLIQDATLTKFAVFLDRPIGEIRVDQSLATIGLDSLVSIELKNWMVRTFQVSLQVSELGGSGSIVALTAMVASRSKLIPNEIRQTQLQDAKITIDEADAPEHDQVKANHEFYCCRTSKELPRYPILDLDEAVKDLLNNIGHFAHTREEYSELSRKAYALAAPGSLGRKLYSQLRAKADDPSVESWIAEYLLKAMYLKRRYGLAPYSNFFGTHFDSVVAHSQAERAAALTRALCEFKRDRDAGILDPDFLGARASCGYSLSWLFNSVREPNVGCDKMMKYPDNEHVAVLRRGHLFKVQLLEGDDIVSYQKLRTTYQAILDLSLEEKYWTGMLTTDNRDTWASNRQTLLSIDDRNAAYLDTLETSVFVMCLDDDSPVTRADRIHSGNIGDSFNRWHDKCLQLVVTANGRSGSLFEHTMIDGMTTAQLSRRMQNAISTLTPGNNTAAHDSKAVDPASLKEISLITTADIDARIDTLRGKFVAITAERQYIPHLLTSFGKALFLAHSVPIKATVDLTIQLASRLYFGYLPASWETVSTDHFHKGRPEIVQVVLKSVVDFCDAALDNTVPRIEARDRLMQAARECNAQIVKGTEGRNYFRLMDVLEVMSQEQEGGEVPEMFSDPVLRRSAPRLIMQTMIETKRVEDPSYIMTDPESVWNHYAVFDDSVEVCFIAPRKSAERYQAALDQAAALVKTIIAAK